MISGFTFLLIIIALAATVIYKIAKRGAEKEAVASVSKIAEDNEALDEPCRIHITVNDPGITMVGGPWKYGFSLNGQKPEFTVIGGELELLTDVKHNALLGYGRGTYGGYKKPNIEEPFRFDAVSGGEVRLVTDLRFEYKTDALWKSNLSLEE